MSVSTSLMSSITERKRMNYQVTLELPDYLQKEVDSIKDFDRFVTRIVRQSLEEEADYQAASLQGALRGIEDDDFSLSSTTS